MKAERDKRLNTPKAQQIDTLFREAIGIKKISNNWRWKKMTAVRGTEKLDEMFSLRGAIAHRGTNSSSVTKLQVEGYFGFVKTVTKKTGDAVNARVKTATGKILEQGNGV